MSILHNYLAHDNNLPILIEDWRYSPHSRCVYLYNYESDTILDFVRAKGIVATLELEDQDDDLLDFTDQQLLSYLEFRLSDLFYFKERR